MKILRLIYDWPPPWQGLAPHPYELTVAQTKLGHHFHIFCGRWPKAGDVEEPEGTTVHPIIRAPLQGTMILTTAVILFFKYIFWRDENEVDLIHSHGHFGIWIYLYRIILRKYFPKSEELKTPFVVHFHNTVAGRRKALEENNSGIKFISRYLDWPLAELSDKWAVKVADACIFVSEETKQQAIAYYHADPEKCYVVESGVNVHTFKKVGQEEFEKTRRDLGLDTLDKVILYQGAIIERKNVHLIIEVLLHLPLEYKLLIVGSGEPSYVGKINEMIKESSLQDRVIMVGYTPYPMAHVSFQASDIFVLPSSFEGFPKVVTQSLACEVPALVSGFKAKEPVRGLYYLENTDPQYIAERIREIVEKPVGVDIDYIYRNFSWEVKANQIEATYQKLCK